MGCKMKKILKIENLDCPVCAATLQSELQKIKGVTFVEVSYVSQIITLDAESEEVLRKVIKHTNGFEEVRVLEENAAVKRESHIKEWSMIGLSALFFLLGFIFGRFDQKWAEIVGYICHGLAYVAVGYPVLISTGKKLAKGHIFDENFLMTVASIGAIALGELGEGVAVMLLYQLGELLQSLAVNSSRKSVADLMDLKSEWATVVKDGEQVKVKPEELNVGDTVFVKAGEKIAADGVLLTDFATLDTKSLTGESALCELKKGDELLSGCLNAGGVFEMKITKPYQDSAVAKILDLVENASSQKAKPEKFITKFEKFYTPIVCCMALLLAFGAPLISNLIVEKSFGLHNFSRWATSALSFLVVSCPCALVISVPLTYFSGVGSCAKNGMLVKGATYLDVLATANTVAFDKTGTLTEGNFGVLSVMPTAGISETFLLSVAAAVEKGSSHPIALAFSGVETTLTVQNVVEKAGMGLTAELDNETVLVGNGRLLAESNITFTKTESDHTLVYVAKDEVYLGYIEIGDRTRNEAKSALTSLKELGINRLTMLTGDNLQRAKKTANEVGVYEVNAELLPDEKLQKANELKGDGKLIYVGDGVNDAPVMAAADCAVSMGSLGSAAAIEASDLVLIADDLTALPKCIRIARKTRKIVLQNIVFSIAMKVMFMTLGVVGILPLWVAVFGDVGVMLLAVLNALRVRLK